MRERLSTKCSIDYELIDKPTSMRARLLSSPPMLGSIDRLINKFQIQSFKRLIDKF